jgi:hypothetical protein
MASLARLTDHACSPESSESAHPSTVTNEHDQTERPGSSQGLGAPGLARAGVLIEYTPRMQRQSFGGEPR